MTKLTIESQIAYITATYCCFKFFNMIYMLFLYKINHYLKYVGGTV